MGQREKGRLGMDEERDPNEAADGSSESAGSQTSESRSRSEPPVSPRLVSRVQTLIDILDTEIASPYRVELFRLLAPGLMPDTPAPATTSAPGGTPPVAPAPRRTGERLERTRLDFATYAPILAQPGRNLLKALVALEVARDQLEIEWVSPAEVERLLADRAGVRSVYRTNLSNALSQAPGMADRRRRDRGRGYEYRISALGRETLHREAALLGA